MKGGVIMKMIIQLGKMTWPSSLTKIEKAVVNHAGVGDIKVIFNASKVKAGFDPEVTATGELTQVVTGLGYDVEAVKVK